MTILKHYGPGKHPSGSSQDAHAGTGEKPRLDRRGVRRYRDTLKDLTEPGVGSVLWHFRATPLDAIASDKPLHLGDFAAAYGAARLRRDAMAAGQTLSGNPIEPHLYRLEVVKPTINTFSEPVPDDLANLLMGFPPGESYVYDPDHAPTFAEALKHVESFQAKARWGWAARSAWSEESMAGLETLRAEIERQIVGQGESALFVPSGGIWYSNEIEGGVSLVVPDASHVRVVWDRGFPEFHSGSPRSIEALIDELAYRMADPEAGDPWVYLDEELAVGAATGESILKTRTAVARLRVLKALNPALTDEALLDHASRHLSPDDMAVIERLLAKHYGPGPHASGTTQAEAHGKWAEGIVPQEEEAAPAAPTAPPTQASAEDAWSNEDETSLWEVDRDLAGQLEEYGWDVVEVSPLGYHLALDDDFLYEGEGADHANLIYNPNSGTFFWEVLRGDEVIGDMTPDVDAAHNQVIEAIYGGGEVPEGRESLAGVIDEWTGTPEDIDAVLREYIAGRMAAEDIGAGPIALLDAIEAAPSTDQVLYRGGGSRLGRKSIADFGVGAEFEDPAISFSTDIGAAAHFKSKSDPVIYRVMNLPALDLVAAYREAGAPNQHTARFMVGESEWLVSGRFRIADIRQQGRDRMVDLEWLGFLDRPVAKHYGPGPHPGTGTPQSDHGRWATGLSAPQRTTALTTSGGFTIHDPSGIVPTTGFSVALKAHEEVFPLSELTPERLRQYRRDHYHALSRSDTFWGAWVDTDTGLVYLDVVKVLDDRDAAIQLGLDEDQIAIFDLEKMEEVRLDEFREEAALPVVDEARTDMQPFTAEEITEARGLEASQPDTPEEMAKAIMDRRIARARRAQDAIQRYQEETGKSLGEIMREKPEIEGLPFYGNTGYSSILEGMWKLERFGGVVSEKFKLTAPPDYLSLIGDEATLFKAQKYLEQRMKNLASDRVQSDQQERISSGVEAVRSFPSVQALSEELGFPPVWSGVGDIGTGDMFDRPRAIYQGYDDMIFVYADVPDEDLLEGESSWGSVLYPDLMPIEPGASSTGDQSWANVVLHEYGHYVQDAIGDRVTGGSSPPMDQHYQAWLDMKASHDRRSSEYKALLDAQDWDAAAAYPLKDSVTYYSMQNYNEFFAETFAVVARPGYDRSAWPEEAHEALAAMEDIIAGRWRPDAGG